MPCSLSLIKCVSSSTLVRNPLRLAENRTSGAVVEYSDVLDVSQFVVETSNGDMWPLFDVFGAGK